MEREQPKPGEVWQHSTGNKYLILAVNKILNYDTTFVTYVNVKDFGLFLQEFNAEGGIIVQNARTAKSHKIESNTEDTWCLSKDAPTPEEINQAFVIAWIRPIENFMETDISSDDDLEVNDYKFERVES